MTDKQILQKWCATYGENDEDIRATMWSAEGMIEFAKEYHKEQLKLCGVMQQRELLIAYEEHKHSNELLRLGGFETAIMDFLAIYSV